MIDYKLLTKAFVALFLICSPMMTRAAGTVLTGSFDGSERSMLREPNPYDCRDRPSGFRAVPFAVEASGSYQLSNPYDSHFYWQGWNTGYTLEIHPDTFEPVAMRRIEPQADGLFALQAGHPYTLVVHSKCPGFEGAWAAAFQGPGTVQSDAAADLPPFSSGKFTANSPTMTSDCGSGYYAWGWGPVHNAPYTVVGPIRLAQSGEYYYGATYTSKACLAVYSAPVDPANRHANRVAILSGFDTTVTLKANTDYWFVSHLNDWDLDRRFGEYLHVLVPPATFRINAGLNGAWYDPANPGEGYFISVFDSRNQVFVANFTFSGLSIPGDRYGHRWYTAAGAIEGASAALDLELTTGGAFNSALPAPQQALVGRLRLQFSDCAHGSIGADTNTPEGSPAGQQEIPLVRLGSDWEQVCKSQYDGLGEVGPL